jgi:hypothetical protein
MCRAPNTVLILSRQQRQSRLFRRTWLLKTLLALLLLLLCFLRLQQLQNTLDSLKKLEADTQAQQQLV